MLDQFMPPNYFVHNGKIWRTIKEERDTPYGVKVYRDYVLVCKREMLVTGLSRSPTEEFTVIVRKDTFTFESYTIPIAALSSVEFEALAKEQELADSAYTSELLRGYFIDSIDRLAKAEQPMT